MCDVESYVYLPLLEELGYIPKHKYSFAPEILEHSRIIARHFGLYDDALFQTGVTELRWDDDAERWIISTDRGDRIRARFVAMANGPLNRPKLPGIPGINEFQGHTFHTSRWDYELHRRRLQREPRQARRQARRHHRHRRHGDPVHPPPRRVRPSSSTSSSARRRRSTSATTARPIPSGRRRSTPGWQQRRMDNFNILVSGGDQDEDLVADGWTDIFRKLTGIAAKHGQPRSSAAGSPRRRRAS